MSPRQLLIAATVVAVLAGCTSAPSEPIVNVAPPSTLSATTSAPPVSSSAAANPAGHVVVVVMENHSYADIIGNSAAPYISSLAKRGANLTSIYAITHPSQPNYVALFSGSTQGITDDACPQTVSGDNLAHQLLAAGLTFAAFSEGLPAAGSQVCNAGQYARRHAPWTNFTDRHRIVSMPFTAFPTDFRRLPALSFVVPDVHDDMHDGTVAEGDAWLRSHLEPYAAWAATHGSQLVVTWDEDDKSADNHIPTIIVGAGIKPQTVPARLTLYSLLRYLEDRFDLSHLGDAASAAKIPLPS